MPPKRKSTTDAAADGASSSKKSRTNVHADAQSLVKAILDDPDDYPILDDDDAVRHQFVQLAQYAKHLEDQVASASQGCSAPKTMTPAQLQAAVEKLRKAANSGITRQMTWKQSCKTGSAKWVYDDVCADPLVFGTLMGQDGPPKFKLQKVLVDEFSELLGGIQASVRFDHLYLTGSHVNVRWSDSGEFKFSGTYGKFQADKD